MYCKYPRSHKAKGSQTDRIVIEGLEFGIELPAFTRQIEKLALTPTYSG